MLRKLQIVACLYDCCAGRPVHDGMAASFASNDRIASAVSGNQGHGGSNPKESATTRHRPDAGDGFFNYRPTTRTRLVPPLFGASEPVCVSTTRGA